MSSDVTVFVDNCMLYRSSKHLRDKTPRLLQPILPLQQAWQYLVVDFNELPPDRYRFDNALVIIDRLSKAL